MAKERVIALIGGIDRYSISYDYVKYLMDELGAGPIIAKITSFGGDVNQALLIKELFENHGDVTVEYIGFNASASTIIGHGAAKTTIREDSMYLVHKPSIWIDTWGRMDADELAIAIEELEGKKKDAEKVTLLIAQDYVNNRGMEMATVEKLMKDARWLSAKEAVELGLVDELIASKQKKTPVTNEVMAMLSANGYPVPTSEEVEDAPLNEESIINKILNKLSPKTQITMNKEFSFVNQVLGVEGVEVKDEKVTLSIAQLTAMNDAIKTKEAEITNLTTEKQTADQGKVTAETALNDFTAKVDEIDPTVKAAADAKAKVAAITAKLAARPGVKAEAPSGKKDTEGQVKDETDYDTIDSLPHNQAADKEIY